MYVNSSSTPEDRKLLRLTAVFNFNADHMQITCRSSYPYAFSFPDYGYYLMFVVPSVFCFNAKAEQTDSDQIIRYVFAR